MLNDYFNPNAMNPGNGWKPQGALGGMQYAEQDMQYQQAMDLQRQLTLAHIKQQQMQNQVYENKDLYESRSAGQAGVAKNDAARSVDLQRLANPNYAPAMVGGEIGGAQSKQAQGRYDMGTVGTRTSGTNMENVYKQFTTAAHTIEAAHAANSSYGQAHYGEFLKQLPPQLQSQMPGTYSKPAMDALVKAVEVQHRQKMAELASTNQMHRDVGQGNNQATVEAARLRAQSRIKNLFEQFQAAKTPEMVDAYGTMILADDSIEAPIRKQVEAGVSQARRQMAEKHGRGQFDINNINGGSGAVVDQVNQRLNSGTDAPFGGSMNIPGVGQAQVLGRNPDGSIRFKAANGRTGTYRPQR